MPIETQLCDHCQKPDSVLQWYRQTKWKKWPPMMLHEACVKEVVRDPQLLAVMLAKAEARQATEQKVG